MATLGYLGPPGTHSEAAAIYLSKLKEEPPELKPYADIYLITQAVLTGEIDAGLVPVENSLEGSINITLDLLAHDEEIIVDTELIWGVHNHLMANCPAEAVKMIYSHAQPLAQCRDYLKQHYPKAQLIATSSTSRAAASVAAADPADGCAAICTERGGELYGLTMIDRDIQDNMTNCTRFYEVKRRPLEQGEQEKGKVLLICQIDGQRAGSLCEVLEEFASRSVNMTRIESRPSRHGLGEYIFFFDLETSCKRENLEAAIEAVHRRSVWDRHCGEFPVIFADNI